MALIEKTKTMNVSIGSGDSKVTYKDQSYPGFFGETIADLATHPVINGRLERTFAKSDDILADSTYPKAKKLADGKTSLNFEQFSKLTEKVQKDYDELPSVASVLSDGLDSKEYNAYVQLIKEKLEGPAKPLKAMAEGRVKIAGGSFEDALEFVFRVNEVEESVRSTVRSVLGVAEPKATK